MKSATFKHPNFKEGRITVKWEDKKDADTLDKKLALRRKRLVAYYKQMVKFYQEESRFWETF